MTEITLGSSALAEQPRRNLELIQLSAEHLLRVVNDILDFSKIDANRLDMDPQPFELRAHVQAIVKMVSSAYAKPGVEIVLDIDPAIPDLLNEALWNLEWMLTMQDPHDGGVYHKLTNKRFDGVVMPHEATSERYVVQKSTAAALDFAAVMATASRVLAKYEEQLPGMSARMLAAAESAWQCRSRSD